MDDDAAAGELWRVLSWNVRGSGRPDLDTVAELIAGFEPDVVALQEVRRAQARQLAARLGWRHHWARKHHPYSPLFAALAEGQALLSPHELVAPVSASISPGVSTWTFRHRIVLAATVRRERSELRAYDTHLASGREPDERVAQARRVAELVVREGAPLRVVAGDLNAAGEPEVVRELRAAGLRDPGGGPTHPAGAPRRRFDYVLVPDAARVVEQHEPRGGAQWAELSDHLPVLVAFRSPG